MRLVLRFRKARPALARFVTASLGVHVALVALVLALPSFRSSARPVEPTMVVELAGAVGPASRTPPSRAATVPPPPPAERPEPEGDHAVREIKPAPKKPKEEKKDKAPPEQPEPPEPAREPDRVGGPPGPAQPGASGASAGARGVTAEDAGDPGLAWYNASVTAALDSAWIRPVLEDARRTLSVVIAFEIDRSGAVRDLAIAASSGIPSLDRSALRAVTDAAPFPRPPAGHDRVRQRIRFDLTPETP